MFPLLRPIITISLILLLPTGVGASEPWFKDVTDSAGLTYRGQEEGFLRSSATTTTSSPESSSTDNSAYFDQPSDTSNPAAVVAPLFVDNEGLYAADVNRDSWVDLLAVGSTTPVLFMNRRGTFKQDTSFPALEVKVSAALFVEIDTDAWKDLLIVPRRGPPKIMKNHRGSFSEPVSLKGPPLTEGIGATAGDYNRDGCADVFILQYAKSYNHDSLKQRLYRMGGGDYRTPGTDNGYRNHLYRGTCSSLKYIRRPPGEYEFDHSHWSLAASFVDVNKDGWQDIHVANDFYRDSLYINQQDGTFRHRYMNRATNRNGMSSEIIDMNQDKAPDILISNIFVDKNSSVIDTGYFVSKVTTDPWGHNVLINQGNGEFIDRAEAMGLQGSGWAWSVSASDFDNDGDEEIMQATQNLFAKPFALSILKRPNKSVMSFVKQNLGRKDDVIVSAQTPDTFAHDFRYWAGFPNFFDREADSFKRVPHTETGFPRMDSRAVVSFDYDRDGDLDLAVSQYNDEFKIFQNRTTHGTKRHWISIKIDEAFRGGYLTVKTQDTTKYVPVSSRSDFHSQESPYFHVGLSNRNQVETISMVWNNGTSISLEDVQTDQSIRLSYPESP